MSVGWSMETLSYYNSIIIYYNDRKLPLSTHVWNIFLSTVKKKQFFAKY